MQSFFTWSKMVNHGIIRILTNETGRITDRYGYDAYGNLLEVEIKYLYIILEVNQVECLMWKLNKVGVVKEE